MIKEDKMRFGMNEKVLIENIDYEKSRASKNIAKDDKYRKSKEQVLSGYLLGEVTEEKTTIYRDMYNSDMVKRTLKKKIEEDNISETFLRQLRNANLMFEGYTTKLRKTIRNLEKEMERK